MEGTNQNTKHMSKGCSLLLQACVMCIWYCYQLSCQAITTC
jgi:hypothetical protein